MFKVEHAYYPIKFVEIIYSYIFKIYLKKVKCFNYNDL